MDVKEKLVELLQDENNPVWRWFPNNMAMMQLADYLISNGVTVQKHGYFETIEEIKYNTVCGSGVKIQYKCCSCCKKPVKFFEDDFCANCGAKLDLHQPPKGE